MNDQHFKMLKTLQECKDPAGKKKEKKTKKPCEGLVRLLILLSLFSEGSIDSLALLIAPPVNVSVASSCSDFPLLHLLL